jgi:hypothetical protein
MKNFAHKIEWYPKKSGPGRFGLPLWRLGEYGMAHTLVLGSKRNEDYVLNEDAFTDPDLEEKVFFAHLKDLAIRLRRLEFKEGLYHGKKITVAGALGACSILGLSPMDFWYMARIVKDDPGEEFWEAVKYTNDLHVDFG